MSSKSNRGVLTKEIQVKANDLLGREITVKELRLMPYLQYVMVNYRKFDNHRISMEEWQIIGKWRDAGLIAIVGNEVRITLEFWRIINELVFMAYVGD